MTERTAPFTDNEDAVLAAAHLEKRDALIEASKIVGFTNRREKKAEMWEEIFMQVNREKEEGPARSVEQLQNRIRNLRRNVHKKKRMQGLRKPVKLSPGENIVETWMPQNMANDADTDFSPSDSNDMGVPQIEFVHGAVQQVEIVNGDGSISQAEILNGDGPVYVFDTQERNILSHAVDYENYPKSSNPKPTIPKPGSSSFREISPKSTCTYRKQSHDFPDVAKLKRKQYKSVIVDAMNKLEQLECETDTKRRKEEEIVSLNNSLIKEQIKNLKAQTESLKLQDNYKRLKMEKCSLEIEKLKMEIASLK